MLRIEIEMKIRQVYIKAGRKSESRLVREIEEDSLNDALKELKRLPVT